MRRLALDEKHLSITGINNNSQISIVFIGNNLFVHRIKNCSRKANRLGVNSLFSIFHYFVRAAESKGILHDVAWYRCCVSAEGKSNFGYKFIFSDSALEFSRFSLCLLFNLCEREVKIAKRLKTHSTSQPPTLELISRPKISCHTTL
jgi:hypothetical protein